MAEEPTRRVGRFGTRRAAEDGQNDDADRAENGESSFGRRDENGFGSQDAPAENGFGRAGGGGDQPERKARPLEGGAGGNDDEQRAPITYVPPEISGRDELKAQHTTAGINFQKYNSVPVRVSGADVNPIGSFAESGLDKLLMENVRFMDYKTPTPIQKYSIPAIMEMYDVMGCAQTGSGKTAGYLLPIIHNMLSKQVAPPEPLGFATPNCLVLCPTRELAAQVDKEASIYTYGTGYKTFAVYGQVEMRYMSNKLRAGCNIIAATTGRFKQALEQGLVKLDQLQYLVLDEADRMLDMGFQPDIEQIVSRASKNRVTLMFSATFPKAIQDMARRFMRDYFFIAVGIVGGACSDVKQVVIKCEGLMEKKEELTRILEESKQTNNGEVAKTLIFCETKEDTDKLGLQLAVNGISSTTIHGNRTQEQREQALADFKRGRKAVLVATNVAARGLDIPDVKHVINFDMPRNADDMDEYVHRIGRTGRVGNQGTATSLFTSRNSGIASRLVEILQNSRQEVPGWLYQEAGMSPPADDSQVTGLEDRFGALDARGAGQRIAVRGFEESVPEPANEQSGGYQQPVEEARSGRRFGGRFGKS